MNRTDSKNRRPRLGVILAAVLIGLLVVVLVGGELTRALVIHHKQSRVLEDRQQSFWLAESALQRATYALASSPDYQGETWRVPADVLGAGRAGVATIQVESVSDPEPGRRIHVEAYYPEDTMHRILCQRKLFVNLSN